MLSWADALMLIRKTSAWWCVKLDWIKEDCDYSDVSSYMFSVKEATISIKKIPQIKACCTIIGFINTHITIADVCCQLPLTAY